MTNEPFDATKVALELEEFRQRVQRQHLDLQESTERLAVLAQMMKSERALRNYQTPPDGSKG